MQNTSSIKTQAKTGNSQSNSTRPNRPNTNSTSRPPQGKSKYANKARANKNRKPVAAKPRGPVLEYVSVCCTAPAQKPRCGEKVEGKKGEVKGLGHFRCTQCRKACKVTPRKPEPKAETPVAEVANG